MEKELVYLTLDDWLLSDFKLDLPLGAHWLITIFIGESYSDDELPEGCGNRWIQFDDCAHFFVEVEPGAGIFEVHLKLNFITVCVYRLRYLVDEIV